MARAIATQADLVFMDEPFNALDFCARDEAQALTLELCNRLGIAIVFVTHDINEAVRMATRLFVLSESPTRIVKEFNVGLSLTGAERQKYKEQICDVLRKEIRL